MAITTSDYLYQIQELTQQNLNILKVINDSFFTNANHLTAAIGDTTYTIPSFLALENKINALRDDFDNIVKLPQTGEAYFTFDGASRVISVNGYNNTPERYVLDPSGGTSGYRYNIEQNDVLKDLLTPKPYVQLDLSDMPNDITAAIVKKVVPLTDELKKRFASLLGESTNAPMTWEEMYKILSGYVDGTDYVEYDTTMRLPARKSIGSATYVIKEITKDEITSDLEEYITIRLVGTADAGLSETGDTSFTKTLTYTLFDGTMEKELAVGDKLTTYDGSAMMEIVELYPSSNTLVVKVLNGDYVNLSVAGEVLPTYFDDNAKLRFFSSPFDTGDKYIRVPLEEDEYVYIVVAPYNERLNIRAPWGGGLLFDVYKLPGDAGEFKKYYDDNVRNIGDILSDISSMMPDSLTRFSAEEFLSMTSTKPTLNPKNLQVVQINTHLNDSATIRQIRTLYNDKLTIKQNIEELDANIADVKKIISSVSFNDTTGIRSTYMNTLNRYNTDRNTYTISLRNVINSIAESSNSADVPIDSAKYHIRGFFDCKTIDSKYRIKRIYVEYRYKNTNNTTGKAMTFGEDQNFLFSDWNIMESHATPRIASHDGSRYVFTPKEDNGNANEPSFNQIDIPISQGESVDIRLKVIYDYCYPFAEVTSAFSDVVTIEFPDELKQDISILDIIEENNKDAETYKMENILSSKGVTAHVNDSVEDQDITYFHSPEHIASGSYTAERRVIPLSDKLTEISNAILELQDAVAGTMSTNVDVALYVGEQRISPAWSLRDPITRLKSYDSVIGGQFDGYVIRQLPIDTKGSELKPVVEAAVSIVIKNTSQHIVSLYPMFPGSDSTDLNASKAYSVFSNVRGEFSNVKFRVKSSRKDYTAAYDQNNTSNDITTNQRLNQFINFRSNSPYDASPYYVFDTVDIIPNTDAGIMHLCPYLDTPTDLCVSLDAVKAQTIFPGKSITIPLRVQYYYERPGQEDKTIGFDIWTSLYRDPLHYEFTIRTMKESTIDDVIIVNPRDITTGIYTPITK